MTHQDIFKKKVESLQSYRNFYQSYQTDESRRRIDALRDIALQMREEQGKDLSFFVGGSVAFGMAEPSSDLELVYVGSNPYKRETEEEIMMRIQKNLGDMKIDIMNQCDLEKIRYGLHHPDFDSKELARFYRLQKVNVPVDDTLEVFVNQIEDLRKTSTELDLELKQDHRPTLVREFYANSFRKYNARLKKRGVWIPLRFKFPFLSLNSRHGWHYL